MKASKLALIVLFGLGSTVALAEGGANRSQQMITEFRASQEKRQQHELVAHQNVQGDQQKLELRRLGEQNQPEVSTD